MPTNDCCVSNVIRIPRNRESLYEDGLIGKIRLTSEMSEDDIFAEIRSVFQVPMAGNDRFCLMCCRVREVQIRHLLFQRYQAHTSAIAPRNAKTPIYILAREPLKVRKILMCSHSGGIDRLFGHYM